MSIDRQKLYSCRTVPEKVIAGMQWSAENLSEEWVYVSVDDDMIVFVPNLVDYLNHLFEPQDKNPASKDPIRPCYEDLPIVCVHMLKENDTPNRFWFSKWYVPYEEYSGSTWPAYCRGGLYLMSNKMTADIFEASRTTAYLSMDDVWITGFMRRKLGRGDCNIMVSYFCSVFIGLVSSVDKTTLSVQEVGGFNSLAGQNGSSPLRRFFVAVLPWREAAKTGRATRYSLRRNTASIRKI